MITHRVTTKAAPEPPVRFYRTIAISFLVITLILLGVVIFFTSKKASIVIVAKNDNKNINLNIIVGGQNEEPSIVGMVTSTVFKWSEKYFPTGNKIVDGVATGEVTIFNETTLDQPLVKITRLLTPAGILFRLAERVLVPAKGQTVASVYADQAGVAGDIGPSDFTIPGLSAEKQKVIYARSAKAMSGGARKEGVLTDEDLKSAETDYLEKVKQAVAPMIAANTVYNQKLISVADHNVKADYQAGDEVTEFNLSGTSTIVIVYYDKNALHSVVANALSERIDANTERILSSDKEPQLSLASYDLAKGTAQFAVYQDVLVTLDADAYSLLANNFFNKSKDAIERYVLGLPHVVGVEVKFSPSWIRRAPAVPDRVKVIVKNVE